MKASDILNMENILSEIKIAKISNATERHNLLVFYRSIAKEANGIREEADIVRKKFMEGNEALVKKVTDKTATPEEAGEYMALNESYRAELDALYGEERKITIEGTVSLENIADALAESGSEIRFGELATVFSILG